MEYLLKYADARGQIHEQVAEAASEKDIRDKFSQQGFLIYTIQPRGELAKMSAGIGKQSKKLNLEKFLIFNQQFVTLIKAGLPILKSLDLLSERLTDAKLAPYIRAVRDDVRGGTLLSEAFAKQGVFPSIYVTSVLAGEKSGALTEVLDRYITYTKLSLAVKKKILVSLMYPTLLIVLVGCLVVFLVTYVVPSFAELYSSMSAQLPYITTILIAIGTTARSYIVVGFAALVALIAAFKLWSRTDTAQEQLDHIKLRTPILGEIWMKYQVAQLSRVISTLLVGGIPLIQALDTAGESLGSKMIKKALDKTRKAVREGQSLSNSLAGTGLFPKLSVDMMEVGESTGALPQMLSSIAEFYEEDVNMRMQAALSLIEPAIMMFMGVFVAFVLVALYLPIFSLADKLG